MCYGGLGEKKDVELAYFWFNISAQSGNKKTEILKKNLKSKLTQQELQVATGLSKFWLEDKKIKKDRLKNKIAKILNSRENT